jgi:signal transduction histidine kinase
MELNVSKKIIYSELVIIAVIFSTLIPYVLVIMDFTPLFLLHYVFITMVILVPIGIFSAFFFMERWECRPIEMLSFYLERRLAPPEEIMAAARIRALNLPLVHASSVLVRYEVVVLIDCLYMGTIGGLPLKETIRLGVLVAAGCVFFPIFSFFLTERLLYPVRQFLAEKTKSVRFNESSVIKINTRYRVLSILLATVIAPLLALSVLVYHRLGVELGVWITNAAVLQAFMSRFLGLMFSVFGVAFLLAAGIGILLATSIANPLGHIVKVIGELERGNFHARANLIANDEIGVLSQSFDKMAMEIEKNRAELEDLNRNLEMRVAEKTENLSRAYERLQLSNQNLAVTNREIEEANRKLKEIDRLKSDFISVVSHELRTPITSIKAFAELILMKPRMPIEKKTKLLSIINNESDRLARLVSDILDLTKIEAGKLSWHITKLSIEDVIQTSVSGIHSLADNKSIVITTSTEHSLPKLYGDKDRLVQVITNILSNAIKFTPQGGRIRIDAHHELSPRPQILVSITDTGVGIPAEDIDLIFEKFRRSGDVLTNRTEGTGLGLAISRQIVQYHGGAIWAASTIGQGSSFTLTLPLNKVWNIEGEQQTAAAHL